MSSKKGKEAYVEPVVEGNKYHFVVKTGISDDQNRVNAGTKLSTGAILDACLATLQIDPAYIKQEALAGRMGARLIAAVAEGKTGRIYISPDAEMEAIAKSAVPEWKPDMEFFQQALGFRIGNYGMTKWSNLFTARSLSH